MKIKNNVLFLISIVSAVLLIMLSAYFEETRYFRLFKFGYIRETLYLYLVYGTFLWYTVRILKLNKTVVFSIIALAVISQKIWIFEVIKRDWTGLVWLKYFHAAFAVIYLLFIMWLLYMEYRQKNKIKTIIIHFVFYSVVLAVFVIYTTNYLFWAIHLRSYRLFFFFILLYEKNTEYIYYLYISIIIFLEIAVIFIINISVMFAERKKFAKKITGIILLPIIFIPVYTAILTRNYGILDWEHWLKTGNIIFGVILYECAYIAYIKTKYNNGDRGPGGRETAGRI